MPRRREGRDPPTAPVALATAGRRTLTVTDAASVSLTGIVLLGVNYALLFWGAQFVPSGLVAILQSTTPMLALVFGWRLGL
jgi:drug/metabolite transporter (DMT)-like permease